MSKVRRLCLIERNHENFYNQSLIFKVSSKIGNVSISLYLPSLTGNFDLKHLLRYLDEKFEYESTLKSEFESTLKPESKSALKSESAADHPTIKASPQSSLKTGAKSHTQVR